MHRAIVLLTSFLMMTSVAHAQFEGAPFKIIGVQGSKALDKIEELRKEGGGYPVILGEEENVTMLLENMTYNQDSMETILQKAAALDLKAWKDARVAGDPDYYHAEDGAWPLLHRPNNAVSAHLDVLTQKPLEKVYIGVIPVQHSWQVPAYLKMGNWNDCPEPEVHAAFFKKWEEQYGARVVAISDVVEFEVAKPPAAKGEAISLAKEHFIYCPDNVLQGTGDLAILADGLLEGKVWYFWWD